MVREFFGMKLSADTLAALEKMAGRIKCKPSTLAVALVNDGLFELEKDPDRIARYKRTLGG